MFLSMAVDENEGELCRTKQLSYECSIGLRSSTRAPINMFRPASKTLQTYPQPPSSLTPKEPLSSH